MLQIPNDIFHIIIKDLDIISLIRLSSTCKEIKNTIPILRSIIHNPIQYLNKNTNISSKYTNLNNMIDDIYSDLNKKSSVSKIYNTQRNNKAFTLKINKNISVYSFIIKNKFNEVKVIFNHTLNKYNIIYKGSHIEVPLLFMFIGFKVLFKYHGYHPINNINKFPTWFVIIILYQKYNGNLLYELCNNYYIL
jgi:hypothetical protein